MEQKEAAMQTSADTKVLNSFSTWQNEEQKGVVKDERCTPHQKPLAMWGY